ncbi:hypothetical protein EHP00_300 [Ecytonucleospora hepatopenaei]|uniref:Uncharacterized protein n=1 Tax=Ecytonucleospora hepatopenaei TaxID=646526 RepID=A0A1W0E7H0_9MICR|nr:hypothetical protein EHP00_300 [Ecytonucleospora hepatopenaei]
MLYFYENYNILTYVMLLVITNSLLLFELLSFVVFYFGIEFSASNLVRNNFVCMYFSQAKKNKTIKF